MSRRWTTSTAIDFALVAYREEGSWQVEALPPRAGDELDALPARAAPQPGDGGALGMVSVDEDFFVRAGARATTYGCCSPTSPPPGLAAGGRRCSTTSSCRCPTTTSDQVAPAGDLDIFADLGCPRWSSRCCSTTSTSTPTSMLGSIAARLGFGEQYDDGRRRRARLSVPPATTVRTDYEASMRLALDEAGTAPDHGDVPIGAVVLDAGRARHRPRRQRREADGDPTAHAEVVALRAAAASPRRVAAERLHAGRHPRAVHDVRRRDRAGPGRPARLRRVRPEGRRGRVAVGRVRDRRLNHRPEVVGGVLADECSALLAGLFATHRAAGDDSARVSDRRLASGTLVGGGVSERPKEHASKACEGATPPWVQIPPPPPHPGDVLAGQGQ